jgi:hypothetical protein
MKKKRYPQWPDDHMPLDPVTGYPKWPYCKLLKEVVFDAALRRLNRNSTPEQREARKKMLKKLADYAKKAKNAR